MDVFLRCAAATDVMPNPFPVKACDCRILYILSGKGKIFIEDKSFQLDADTLCYYPTGTEYYPISSKSDPLYFITINLDLNRNNTHRSEIQLTVKSDLFDPKKAIFSHETCENELFKAPFVIANAGKFRETLLNVSREFRDGNGNEPAASALLQYVLYKISERNNEKETVVTLCRQAVDFINKNYANISDNRQIAEALGYHDYYLNRIFKENMGTTLHRYLMDLRMQKAATALVTTNLSVGEIAKCVGFYNADHFSKRFSQKFGISPTLYRRRNYVFRLI